MSKPVSNRPPLNLSGKTAAAALSVLILSAVASALISFLPPPSTVRSLPSLTNPLLREARWWKSACAGVQCELCPFNCFLPEGMRGLCNVRVNVGNRLQTLVYAQPISVHVDPIEKKPIFHLYPGSGAFSISTVGCNLKCAFCQNWEISQSWPEQAKGEVMTPEEVVRAALASGSRSIAYTYGEPTVFYEYMYDTAVLAKQNGLRNVVITAGYINPGPLHHLAPYLDVVKVDLKGFNEKFYKNVVGGELRYVLRTLVMLKKLGIFVEVVNLVVPTLNDNMDEIRKMSRWIVTNLGPDTPLFFSRFTPQYKLQNLPPTPIETLEEARAVARSEGLRYVYIGNVPGHEGENTECPTCHRVLIRRHGFAVLENRLLPGGLCPYDETKIPGIWD